MQFHNMRAASLVSPDELEHSLQESLPIRIRMQEGRAEFDFWPLGKSVDNDGFEVYSGIAKLQSTKMYSELRGGLKFVAQLSTRNGEVSCNTYLLSAESGQAKKWTQDEYDAFVEALTSRRPSFAVGLIGVYEKRDRYIATHLFEPLILPGMEGDSCELSFYASEKRAGDDLSNLYDRARKLVAHILRRDGVRRVGVLPLGIRVSFNEGDENSVLEDIEYIYFENFAVEVFEYKKRSAMR